MASPALLLLSWATIGFPSSVPQDTSPRDLLSSARALDSGHVQDAIQLAERYTAGHQRDARGFLVLGNAYAARMPAGRFRALEAYRQAKRLTPRDPEPSYRMAIMAIRLGGDDGERIAREELERIMTLDPLYKDAWSQWLILYRNAGGRRRMIERLALYRVDPLVGSRIAQLLIEEERYTEANRLLDSLLTSDSVNSAWLALRAQSALEAGDTVVGIAAYQRALMHAETDSSGVLWRQVVGIATTDEVRAWGVGVPASQRGAWLDSFWARRNPNLLSGTNHRIAEHFARFRFARKNYPLLHPLVSYHRSAIARILNLEPSEGERIFHERCEVYQALAPSSGLDVQLPGVSRARDRQQSSLGALSHLTPEEKESAQRAARLALLTGRKLPPGLSGAMSEPFGFAPTVLAPLGLDLRGVDSVAARVGYNLATGLDDRGIMYLRFGPPETRRLGGDNATDPQCNSTEVERWRYAQWGEVRFAKPSAFSQGLRTTPEMVFRPMNPDQFEAMKVGLTRDASSEPSPQDFGIWTAQFRNPQQPVTTDLLVTSTDGELAGDLVGDTGGSLMIRQGSSGTISLTAPPGRYVLLAQVRQGGSFGRQTLSVRIRGFGGAPAISDLLLASPWTGDTIDRTNTLAHVKRSLTFGRGETVRVYAEVYSLARLNDHVDYHVKYRLLKTDDPRRDVNREDWRETITVEFDRVRMASSSSAEVEFLDIAPGKLLQGTYLIRLEVRDNTVDSLLGRSTAAFTVR